MKMTKGRGKRKGNGKGSFNKGGVSGSATSSSSALDDDDRHKSLWSVADECAHYAALGCHVANVARCHDDVFVVGGTSSSSSSSRRYEEFRRRAMRRHPWLLDVEYLDPDEYDPSDVFPEVAMDDGDDDEYGRMTLAVANVAADVSNICYVTVYDATLLDGNGDALTIGTTSTTTKIAGTTTTTTTTTRQCTTFVVSCPPRTLVRLCSLANDNNRCGTSVIASSWSDIEIESDVRPVTRHPDPDDEHARTVRFPFLRGGGGGDDDDGVDDTNDIRDTNDHRRSSPPSSKGRDGHRRYLCTQSENGELTHFFAGNHHAIDFACPIGTPLYSPVNGTVVDVRDAGDPNDEDGVVEVGGIAARNMFRWNSMMIRAADGDDDWDVDDATTSDGDVSRARGGPLYVEFVHIQTGSCAVRPGDEVRAGRFLCRSGSAGFSPEPHLHVAAYRGDGDDAATVRVRFERSSCLGGGEVGTNGGGVSLSTFLPRAGGWYDSGGLVRDAHGNDPSVDTITPINRGEV